MTDPMGEADSVAMRPDVGPLYPAAVLESRDRYRRASAS